MADLTHLVPNQSRLAREMGCNRIYLGFVLKGRKPKKGSPKGVPISCSPRFAKRVEAATHGRVKAVWLLGLEDPPSDLLKAS